MFPKEDEISGGGTAWHVFKPAEIAVVHVQGKQVPCLINLLNQIDAQVISILFKSVFQRYFVYLDPKQFFSVYTSAEEYSLHLELVFSWLI